eukprot:16439688-Heterocapsa_arctica.AAC.1
MRRVLHYTGEFDGCAYGLQDAHGYALRKPWRVVTTMREIASALSRWCNRAHRHGVTCGKILCVLYSVSGAGGRQCGMWNDFYYFSAAAGQRNM